MSVQYREILSKPESFNNLFYGSNLDAHKKRRWNRPPMVENIRDIGVLNEQPFRERAQGIP